MLSQLCMLQKLFDLAIKKSLEGGLGGGRQWYPHTYMFGYLMRRAEFVVKHAMTLLGRSKKYTSI